MKKLLLSGVAALFLATGAAHAQWRGIFAHIYGLNPDQIYEGPSIIERFLELGKRRLKEMGEQ